MQSSQSITPLGPTDCSLALLSPPYTSEYMRTTCSLLPNLAYTHRQGFTRDATMTELARLKFYATQPHPCSYLPEEQATTLFLDPSQPMDVLVYAELSEMGFRRSGDHLYRPHCQQCTACIPARIPANLFTPTRQQRRILKRNEDISVRSVRPVFSEEYYSLYVRYIEQRHADGDMYPPSRDQFSTFLVRDLPFSRFYEFRLQGRLVAIAVTDLLRPS
jgi:arginyl-tRNA--protein-N-Asp/Glu arginylyltransferase